MKRILAALLSFALCLALLLFIPVSYTHLTLPTIEP